MTTVFWRVEIMAEDAGRAKRGEVMDSGVHFTTVDRLAFHRNVRVVAFGHDEHSAMQRALIELDTIYQPELNLEYHPDIRKLVFPKPTPFPPCSECDKPKIKSAFTFDEKCAMIEGYEKQEVQDGGGKVN